MSNEQTDRRRIAGIVIVDVGICTQETSEKLQREREQDEAADDRRRQESWLKEARYRDRN